MEVDISPDMGVALRILPIRRMRVLDIFADDERRCGDEQVFPAAWRAQQSETLELPVNPAGSGAGMIRGM
jgi:hypothetical protein